MFSRAEMDACEAYVRSVGERADVLRARAAGINVRHIRARMLALADHYEAEALRTAHRISGRVAAEGIEAPAMYANDPAYMPNGASGEGAGQDGPRKMRRRRAERPPEGAGDPSGVTPLRDTSASWAVDDAGLSAEELRGLTRELEKSLMGPGSEEGHDFNEDHEDGSVAA